MMMDFAKMTTGLVMRTGRGLLKLLGRLIFFILTGNSAIGKKHPAESRIKELPPTVVSDARDECPECGLQQPGHHKLDCSTGRAAAKLALADLDRDSCTCRSGATPLRCPQHDELLGDKFVIGDRVRHKDGAPGWGTVTVRYDLHPHLIVKWDDGISNLHDETSLVHLKAVEPHRARRAPDHEHQFSCTCCHGGPCPQHDEGIKHCVICDKTIGDKFVDRGQRKDDLPLAVDDLVQRRNGPPGWGVVTSAPSRAVSTLLIPYSIFVVRWENSGYAVQSRVDEANLVRVDPTAESGRPATTRRYDKWIRDAGRWRVDKFVVGDRVRCKFGPGGEGTIKEMREMRQDRWRGRTVHVRHVVVRWDDRGRIDGLWGETALVRC